MNQRIGFVFEFLFLLLISTISFSNCDFSDGTLLAGDVYGRDVMFSKKAYDIYQIPYGVVVSAMTFNGPDVSTGHAIVLLTHTSCPDGANCDYHSTEQLLVRFKLEDLKVNSARTVDSESYGSFVSQSIFPFSDGHPAYMLMNLNSFGNVVEMDLSTGRVSQSYDAYAWIISGDFDTDSNFAFLLAINFVELLVVNAAKMVLNCSINLDKIITTENFPHVVYHSPSHQAFVIGHSKPMNTTILLQIDPAFRQVIDQLTDISGLPRGYNTSFAFQNKTNGDLYFIFEPNRGINCSLSWPAECNNFVTTIWRLSFPSDTNYETQKKGIPMFANATQTFLNVSQIAPLTGYFLNGNYLYLTTSHGELVRILAQKDALYHNGTMTIVIDSHNKNNYSSLYMPVLTTPTLFDGSTAWIAADWWGMLIRVHLDDFCDDSLECEGDNDFEDWKFTLILVFSIIGAILFLSITCAVMKAIQGNAEKEQTT